MRADNDGEGGILALIALVEGAPLRRRGAEAGADRARHVRRRPLLRRRDDHPGDLGPLRGRGGEGRRRRAWSRWCCRSRSRSSSALFAIQRFGTHGIGRVFGPVMVVWFVVIAAAGLGPGRRPPGDRQGALAPLRGRVLRRPLRHRLHLARRDRADDHRRRGALRRHGPLRPQADQPRLVPRRLPGADPQLHGPGIADPRNPERDRQPVLPADPALGPDADGAAGDGGDGDRLAGGHLRRLLGHPPGGPARLPAAADDPPHLGRRDRPGLRAGGQLVPARRGASRWSSASAPRPSSPPPTGSPSPARSPSTPCSSSSSPARSGANRAGWSRSAPPSSSPSTSPSSAPT